MIGDSAASTFQVSWMHIFPKQFQGNPITAVHLEWCRSDDWELVGKALAQLHQFRLLKIIGAGTPPVKSSKPPPAPKDTSTLLDRAVRISMFEALPANKHPFSIFHTNKPLLNLTKLCVSSDCNNQANLYITALEVRLLTQHRLPQLTMLYLDSNRLGDQGAAHLAATFPKLIELSIPDNCVTNAGLTAIARSMSSLKKLVVNFNSNISIMAVVYAVLMLKKLQSMRVFNHNSEQPMPELTLRRKMMCKPQVYTPLPTGWLQYQHILTAAYLF